MLAIGVSFIYIALSAKRKVVGGLSIGANPSCPNANWKLTVYPCQGRLQDVCLIGTPKMYVFFETTGTKHTELDQSWTAW